MNVDGVFVSLVERKQEIMTRNRNNWFRNKGQILYFLHIKHQWHFYIVVVFLADFINTRTGNIVRSEGNCNQKMLQAKLKLSFSS